MADRLAPDEDHKNTRSARRPTREGADDEHRTRLACNRIDDIGFYHRYLIDVGWFEKTTHQ